MLKPDIYKTLVLMVTMCVVLTLAACSTGPTTQPNGETRVQQSSDVFETRQEEFSRNNPIIISQIGELTLTVRMATAVDTGNPNKTGAAVSAIGAGALALGLMAPPLFASTLVVGGILLLPLGSYVYRHEKKVQNTIHLALINAHFTQAVDEATKRRLKRAFPQEDVPKLNVEVVIETFGVEPAYKNQNCFVIAAVMKICGGDDDLKEYRLVITPWERSPDAPPPYCATLEQFARDEGRLVKDTLAEYSELLAVMAIDRIRERGKK
jgi:hypothetical protein